MKLSKRKTKVLILSHFLINPFQNEATSTIIRKFLLDKVERVVQIEQPFPRSTEKFSSLRVYDKSKLQKQFRLRSVKKPEWLTYLTDLFVTPYFVLRTFSRYELCVACDSLSFISILPLKKMGLIKKVVYYSVDYVENRFSNGLMNKIYHWTDRTACQSSEENWVAAKVQIIGRRENGLQISKCAPFRVVPIGFMNKEIKVPGTNQINLYNLVFCGGLRESAGPQLAVAAMPRLLKKFPEVILTIIGGGDYKRNLVALARKLDVKEHIRFLGAIASHEKIVNVLARCGIGLAPYVPVPGSISYKSDPGKIKLYLACGLPVVTTKIATSHKILTRNKAGLVVDYDGGDLFKKISYLLGNRKKYLKYRGNVAVLAKRYDADVILGKAFQND